MRLRMPDVTPVQIVAVIGAAITIAVVFGVSITTEQREAILAFVGVIASVLLHSDAKIRNGRAAIAAAGEPPAPPDDAT